MSREVLAQGLEEGHRQAALTVRVLLALDWGGCGAHQGAQGRVHSPAWSLHLSGVTCQDL